MIGEEAIAIWIAKKLANVSWDAGARKLKDKKEARKRAQRLAKAIERALDKAERDLGDARAMVPVSLALRVREYLLTCAMVIGGEAGMRASCWRIDRALAEELFEPMETLFNVDVNTEHARALTEAYLEFAARTRIEPADLRPEARPAVELFFEILVKELQEALRTVLGPEMESATGDAIRVAHQRTVKAIEQLRASLEGPITETIERVGAAVAETMRASDLSEETRLGPAIDDRERLTRRLQAYADLLLDPVHSPLERPLHRRIREVIRGSGLHLGTVDELYVPSRLGRLDGRTQPAGKDGNPEAAAAARGTEPESPVGEPPLMHCLGERCVGLTGSPGSGKTMELCTVGRHLATKLRDGEGWTVPIYVRLSPESRSLKQEVRRAACGFTDLVASALEGREGLGVLLLIDGFDEAGDQQGVLVLEGLAQLLGVCPRVGAVLAGRHESVSAWRRIGRQMGGVYELQPLGSDAQQALVERLCSSIDPERRVREPERIVRLVEYVVFRGSYSPREAELARFLSSPLYLALYVVLALLDDDEPAETMADLMRRFVRRFVLAAMVERGVPDALDATDALLEVLETIAADGAWLAGGRLRDVDRARVAQAAASTPRFRTVSAMVSQPPERLAAALMTATGLFEGRGESGGGPWTFSLYPFQEYFAARGCVRAAKESERPTADALLETLGKATWSAELAPHVVALLVNDAELKLEVAERRRFLEGILTRISTALDDARAKPAADLNLMVAVRDQLIAWDPELEGSLVAERLDEELHNRFPGDPVLEQLRRIRGREIPVVGVDPDPPETTTLPPGPQVLLTWDEERRRIREQVASVADWLLHDPKAHRVLPAPVRAELEQATSDEKVEPRLKVLPGALATLLAGQDGEEWHVREYGPTLAAFPPDTREPSWILVPHGPFIAGDIEIAFELPVRVGSIAAPFWIGLNPVTVRELQPFVGDDGYGTKLDGPWWDQFRAEARKALDRNQRGTPFSWERQLERPGHPATGVSWFEAAAFCLWRNRARAGTKGWGGPHRLPTEAEWEKAARGLLGRRWPWGSAWRPGLAVQGREFLLGNTEPVTRDMDRSPFGVKGMAGNVWEWTATSWQGEPFGKDVILEDVKDLDPISVRGGSLANDRHDVRCAYRPRGHAGLHGGHGGFRCLRDVI